MTQEEITVTSGRISGLNEDTSSQETEANEWNAKSISVTVTASPDSDRMRNLNDHLRGNLGRNAHASR